MASALRLRLLLLLAVAAAATGAGGRVDLWPMPASVTRGAQTLLVSRDLKLSTAGSSYADGKGILKEAFQRMVAVVELDHAINGTYSSQGAPVLAGVRVAVRSPSDVVRTTQTDSILMEPRAPKRARRALLLSCILLHSLISASC